MLTEFPLSDATNDDILGKYSFSADKNQLIRQMALQKYCQKKEIQYNEPLENPNLWLLKFSKKEEIMMCIMPKVICRNWYRVFLAIDGIHNASLVQDFDSADTNIAIT